MKTGVLKKDGVTLAGTVELALRPLERMRGLLGRSSLGPGRAMYIAPCGSIHTFLMKFPIDVVFVNQSLDVTKILRNVRPNRIVSGGRGARAVLEMESGWLAADAIGEGDKLTLIR